MELTIIRPLIENLGQLDKNMLTPLLINIELLYQRIKRLNISTKYDLEWLLMQMESFGKKYGEYYTKLHSFCTIRARNFRNAMQSIAKYCIQVADFMLNKLQDKLNPENNSILIAIQQLVHPEIPVEPEIYDKHRNIILRIIKLMSYWYFPQGDAESDNEN